MVSEERFKELLCEFFDERARVDAETHGEHHQWINEQIAAQKARREMYRTITKAVLQWSIPVIAGAIWYYLTNGHWPINQ